MSLIIWGASFLFIAEGLRAIGPCGVTFVRVLVGFATLALLPAARGPLPRSDRAAVASVLARRPPWRGLAAGQAVGLAGTVLVAWPTLHEGRSSLEGVLLTLAAVTSYGFALNLARAVRFGVERH